MKKEEQYFERLERRELRKALRIHEKQKKKWEKAQDPLVQKRLKEDKKRTKGFYKKYSKANMNTTPGQKRQRQKKYRNDGIIKK